MVEAEVEEESELSISVKTGKNGAVKQEEPEVVSAKTTKKRKTKAEKEAEVMPLRPRSQGLRMFVGAHVSAAKGWLQCFHLVWISGSQSIQVSSMP